MVTSRRTSSSIYLVLGVVWASALPACLATPNAVDAGAEAGAADGPSVAKPELVCQHLRELAAKDSDDAETLDEVQRECVQTLTAMQSDYQTFSACVEQAGSVEAVSACEQALIRPVLLGELSGRVERVCDHVITMLTTELGDLSSINSDQVQQLRERCLTDAGKTLEINGEEAFDRQAACILAAQNLKDLEGCGGFE